MDPATPGGDGAVDLLVTYDWPYDEPFVGLLVETARRAGRSVMVVGPESLPAALEALQAGRIRPQAYLDRAADTDPAFRPLEEWAVDHIPRHFNPAARRRHIWRKTNLHWELIRAGLHTPYTLVVPAWDLGPILGPHPDVSPLGSPFSIKPDIGGGGWGVVTDARDWDDVERARRALPEDDLILQQFVEPASLDGRRAWFRVFYACGRIVPCWWNDRTHLFGPTVSAEERAHWGLDGLWTAAGTIAGIAQIELFSSEVARVDDGRLIVVDYVNDPVDLRFLPHAREGMPWEVAGAIAQAIVERLGDGDRAGP